LKLQTNIPFKREVNNQIDYTSKIVLLGSCFSKNMGHKFKYLKFISNQNPFGILFHTKAIETIIRNAAPGDRIAQMCIKRVTTIDFEVVEKLSTVTGRGGFGSTGL